MAYQEKLELLCQTRGETLADLARLLGTDENSLRGELEIQGRLPFEEDSKVCQHFGLNPGDIEYKKKDEILLFSSRTNFYGNTVFKALWSCFNWIAVLIPLCLCLFFAFWAVGEWFWPGSSDSNRLLFWLTLCCSVGLLAAAICYPSYRGINGFPRSNGVARTFFRKKSFTLMISGEERTYLYSLFDGECDEGKDFFALKSLSGKGVVLSKEGLTAAEICWLRKVFLSEARYSLVSSYVPPREFPSEEEFFSALAAKIKKGGIKALAVQAVSYIPCLGLGGFFLARFCDSPLTGWGYSGFAFLAVGALQIGWNLYRCLTRRGNKTLSAVGFTLGAVGAVAGIALAIAGLI